jgi:hypothetical protein
MMNRKERAKVSSVLELNNVTTISSLRRVTQHVEAERNKTHFVLKTRHD